MGSNDDGDGSSNGQRREQQQHEQQQHQQRREQHLGSDWCHNSFRVDDHDDLTDSYSDHEAFHDDEEHEDECEEQQHEDDDGHQKQGSEVVSWWGLQHV